MEDGIDASTTVAKNGWSALVLMRDGGHGFSIFLAEMKFADGALLKDDEQRKELTMECPGIRITFVFKKGECLLEGLMNWKL